MTLHLVDHAEPRWSRRYGKHGRENGAATYSRDLVAHQAPLWADIGERVTVSTCPLLHGVEGLPGGDLAVQYLHEYSYADPIGQARKVADALAGKYSRVVFVTAYRPLQRLIVMAGYEAVWVPMTIDVARIREAAGTPDAPIEGRRVAYYGNLIGSKAKVYTRLARALRAEGWQVDHVSGPQSGTLPQLAGYRYGIGVGRCALEMTALGVRVMVAGARFGGIVTNAFEWETQRSVNFNGRVITYDRSAVSCAAAWDDVVAWTADVDAPAGADVVRGWVAAHA